MTIQSTKLEYWFVLNSWELNRGIGDQMPTMILTLYFKPKRTYGSMGNALMTMGKDWVRLCAR